MSAYILAMILFNINFVYMYMALEGLSHHEVK